MIRDFAYLQAADLDEALAHLRDGGGCVHAGGSDLVTCLRDGTVDCPRVISISALDQLRGIRARDGGLTLGALTTLTAIQRDQRVQAQYPALAAAAGAVGSPQLRHQGTIGGNLCQKPRCWYWRGDDPCLRQGGDTCDALGGQNDGHAILGGDACVYVHPSDTAVALTAYQARVRIASARGERTVPLAEFFVLPADDPTRETVVGPAEVVTAIELPAPPSGHRGVYRKIRSRGAWDFALTSAAVVIAFDGDDPSGPVRDVRLVLGGVAPAPWRVPAAEDALRGQPLGPRTIGAAAAAAVAEASPLAHNGYKVDLVTGVLREELTRLAS